MTAYLRCVAATVGCGWHGRRTIDLLDPCSNCGGPVAVCPVPGPLLAQLLVERFGPDAAASSPPQPTPKQPKQPAPKWNRKRDRKPNPFPAFGNREEPKAPKAKGRTLEELLDEWP